MREILIARRAAGALLGLLAFAMVAAAQSPGGRPAAGPRAGPRQASARAEEVRQAMEQMVIARMKVALHLTSDQEAKVIPRVQELLEARRDHAARRRDAMARVRNLLLDETAGDQEIGRALRDLRALEDDFRGREEGLRDAIDRSLTPRQQARMVFFEARLRRVMQRRIQEALGGGRRVTPGPEVEERPDELDAPEGEP